MVSLEDGSKSVDGLVLTILLSLQIGVVLRAEILFGKNRALLSPRGDFFIKT